MVFLWCGLHIPDEERCQDPFESPVLIPCKNIECDLFREEYSFCIHMITGGKDGNGVIWSILPVVPRLGHLADLLAHIEP